MKKISLVMAIIISLVACLPTIISAESRYPGFRVQGRHLYDNTGEKVVLYGPNVMTIWGEVSGEKTFAEIEKTGANAIRIVWLTTGSARNLDLAIYNCRKNNMIPMIELHDATGEWDMLPELVDYWTRPDIVEVIQKHQEYLLINIGNEVGQQVSDSDFRDGYETAVTRMREAGIHVPLIIDGADWGKDIDILKENGPYLIDADPDSNLMFSIHMWWPYMWGNDEQRVIDEINECVEMELPLIVGEFAHAWEEHDEGAIPWETILEQCYYNEIGYMPWSWGPGNNPQDFLDMTTDGTYDTLHGWGLEVAVTHPYSIKNIAVRPDSMLEPSDVPPPDLSLPEGSLSRNKPVFASSTEPDLGNVPENVVDGNVTTRWASEYSDPQYIYVDLEDEYELGEVYIEWEDAYAGQYKIQVSNDAENWTDVFTEYNGDGGIDQIEIEASGRYVRLYCMQRATEWGNSLFVFEVYPPEGSVVEPPTFTLGDINNDGVIDSTDYTLMSRHILEISSLTGDQLLAADLNGDGVIDSTDSTILQRYLLDIIQSFPAQQ
ncbi:discoidin domain-containing protein [Herbivorax sp. ANBcel31]|uniref:discoidin domain-containing protein n=1 Tax=Herbivorax sp. ANBcel31 TaxID=3069754 RepID=UPI0027B79840|nr:discoidin domain-containing protein [Herbivorax sp. ANBcel31]MDQ2087777.1 discoidin domain-containing protein [Herbivorax sp. ANBcel31]